MKFCKKCSLEKEENLFYKRSKGGLSTYCIGCEKLYRKQHYVDNKAKYLEKARKNNENYLNRNREIVWNYLLGKSCEDCGENDPIVLQFDHVFGKKVAAVSVMVGLSYSEETLIEEIKKCQIRCANCHLKKTSKDFNHWKSLRTS